MSNNQAQKSSDSSKDQKKDNVSEIARLKTELAQIKKDYDEMKSKYLRALADYQNLEKRTAAERQEVRKMAIFNVVSHFLVVLDNLDKASNFVVDPGLNLIRESFMQTLFGLGLKEIDIKGKQFDPYLAEAIETVPGDKDNIVVEIIRRGYELDGRVLRPAQVKVSKLVKHDDQDENKKKDKST